MSQEQVLTAPIEEGNQLKTSKMVLYFGIFSICMLFAGLSSAYVVSSYSELWVNISMPKGFYVSTFLILLSSATIKLATMASSKGKSSLATTLLAVTLLLGLGFSAAQYVGWSQLVGKGSYFSGHIDNLDGVYGEDYTIRLNGEELVYEAGKYYYPNDVLFEKPLNDEISIYSNASSSYIYVFSAVHLLHVLGGLLFLLVVLIKAFVSKSRVVDASNLKLGAIYWHFVDGLWIYLFLFLLFIH